MIFIKQKIEGVYLIKPSLFKDNRGAFRRHFCIQEFKKKKIVNKINQCNVSENFKKGTLRGFHYQTGKSAEAKTLSCIKGSIYDVVVDLRPKSKTYSKWISVELNSKNRMSVHIPKGCANAFLTLKNNSIIHYYCSNKYDPKKEKGIRYNDPFFKFKWPIKPKIISEKDRSHNNYLI
jgi:dTDP-4-dehydrorhamnose 3,5-epimerase